MEPPNGWKMRWAYLSRSEGRGFLVVIGMCMVLVAWITYERYYATPPAVDMAPFEEALARLQQARGSTTNAQVDTLQIDPFDPNELKLEDWMAFGLTAKQAGSIIKYQEKGGRFRVPSDVAKMYVVSDELFARLEPFIVIPAIPHPRNEHEPPYGRQEQERPPETGRADRSIEKVAPTMVELNDATVEDLEPLPWVGAKTAAQIIKYRDLLGGFIDTEQLKEVYILRDRPEAIAAILPLVSADPAVVQKINVNNCEVEQLGRHPYLEWNVARALIAYRGQHGDFKTVADIRGCALIDEALFRKLAPYLSVE